jgi:uncharacterized protein
MRQRMFKLLRPQHTVTDLTQLDVEALFKQGIRGLLMDLDNTLMPWDSQEVDERVVAWIAHAKKTPLALCLLSNATHKRVHQCIEPLGLPFVALARKPLLPGFRKAMRILGTSPTETAMIGDQVFTDVLGANLLGLHSILIELSEPKEQWWMKGARKLEKWVLRSHKPLLPPE